MAIKNGDLTSGINSRTGCICVINWDSSNAPKYREGDIVYVKPSKVPQIGNTVVAIMHTLSRIRLSKRSNFRKLILQSFDGASQKQIKMSELKKIYPVLMSVEKI